MLLLTFLNSMWFHFSSPWWFNFWKYRWQIVCFAWQTEQCIFWMVTWMLQERFWSATHYKVCNIIRWLFNWSIGPRLQRGDFTFRHGWFYKLLWRSLHTCVLLILKSTVNFLKINPAPVYITSDIHFLGIFNFCIYFKQLWTSCHFTNYYLVAKCHQSPGREM